MPSLTPDFIPLVYSFIKSSALLCVFLKNKFKIRKKKENVNFEATLLLIPI